MRILFVVTSQDRLGHRGARTGFRFDEFATVYLAVVAAGAEVVIASPLGGAPPIEPDSHDRSNPSEVVSRFMADSEARDALTDTLELRCVEAMDFDAAFYPGGMGSLWDLPNQADSIAVLAALHRAARPMAFLSHGPAALCRVQSETGRAIVAGRTITLIGAAEDPRFAAPVPGLGNVEEALRAAGAKVVRAADGVPHVVADDLLITGQNPASASQLAETLLAAIASRSSTTSGKS
jgi:putative intracellular protease/amidase